MLNVFWSRWKNEYLQTLQMWSKWNENTCEVFKGDIVIIKDDNQPRNGWLSGPYAGFSEGGFEMENLVTENELSLQVDPS